MKIYRATIPSAYYDTMPKRHSALIENCSSILKRANSQKYYFLIEKKDVVNDVLEVNGQFKVIDDSETKLLMRSDYSIISTDLPSLVKESKKIINRIADWIDEAKRADLTIYSGELADERRDFHNKRKNILFKFYKLFLEDIKKLEK